MSADTTGSKLKLLKVKVAVVPLRPLLDVIDIDKVPSATNVTEYDPDVASLAPAIVKAVAPDVA